MEAGTPEEQLLLHAREGDCPRAQRLLQSRLDLGLPLDINCRCEQNASCHDPQFLFLKKTNKQTCFVSAVAAESKSSCGWTALHLASNFGHKDVVEELLKVRRWDYSCSLSRSRYYLCRQ